LGGATVICSDKTGTLTKNEMTVTEGFVNSGDLIFSGSGYAPEGECQVSSTENQKADEELKILFRVAKFCNDAKLSWNEPEKKWQIFGDPTEGALLTAQEKYAQKEGQNTVPTEEEWKTLKSFPFSSLRKRMSILGEWEEKRELLVKGAPEMVIAQCTHIQVGVETHPLTDEERERLLQRVDEMSEKALRVLAFAKKSGAQNESFENDESAEKNLVFVGCLGMIDPPREEVSEAIKMCQTAGIRILVITGDNPKTAKAIAQQIGIFAHLPAKLITGADLSAMSDEDLKAVLQSDQKYIPLFARTAPEDKRRIVEILQELGEIVTVTGDGVNDAPALKKANIGVAMGSGTEVAKEAAQMVLLTDSFANIVSAIAEGRVISTNLRKFVWFIFSGNLGELVLVLGPLLFHLPVALTVGMILMVDLGTDVLPAIALGIDTAEPGVMEKPPRDPKKRLMQSSFIISFTRMGIAIGLSALFAFLLELYWGGWNFGGEISDAIHRQAMTVAFVTIVLGQLWNAFSARSITHSSFSRSLPPSFSRSLPPHPFLWVATGLSILLLLVALYFPPCQMLFKTVPLSFSSLCLAIGFSLIPFLGDEIRKSGKLFSF